MQLPEASTTDDYVKLFGTGGVAVAAAFLWLRKWLSGDRVDRAADDAAGNIIENLQALLKEQSEARREADARADRFAAERNDLYQKLGELKGQVAALTGKLNQLEQTMGMTPTLLPAPEQKDDDDDSRHGEAGTGTAP